MYNKVQPLTLVEQQMPLARFYYGYPMHDLLEELKAQIFAPPVDPDQVVKAENFWDWLMPYGQYTEHENAYCMMSDGSGFIATYLRNH